MPGTRKKSPVKKTSPKRKTMRKSPVKKTSPEREIKSSPIRERRRKTMLRSSRRTALARVLS